MPKKTEKPSKTAARSGRQRTGWLWGVVAAAAVAALIFGYFGIGSRPHTTARGDVLPPIVQNPPASGFTWKYRAYAIKTRKPAQLVRGPRITVVMLMASWCLYCAYDDKYVWPAILHTPGLTLDIVDVSNHGGIGDPGPESPPFTGQDHATSNTISASAMVNTMRQYAKQFHLTAPNVHVYADPKGISYWSITDFPTVLLINNKGQAKERINGALTVASAKKLVNQILSSER